tara:strand:+ start:707 stop:889 length:183 start_codon:yes stop_codon:yes gene_type:complete
MKNLSSVANRNVKFLSSKQKKVEEKPMQTNSLLSKPKYDNIEDNTHLSLKLKDMVTKALA